MIQDILNGNSAILDPNTLSWTSTDCGHGTKLDRNDEEGYVLLPEDQGILVVDVTGVPVSASANVMITTNVAQLGPFVGIMTLSTIKEFSTIFPQTIIGDAVLVDCPDQACCSSSPTNVAGKIAFFLWICSSVTSVENIYAAGAIAAIAIEDYVSLVEPEGCATCCPSFGILTSDAETILSNMNTVQLTIEKPSSVPQIICPNSEIFDIKTETWRNGGDPGVELSDPGSEEIGPSVLRPDGTVVTFGGIYGNTAIYNSKNTKWTVGEKMPIINGVQMGVPDGMGVLEPNENILIVGSAGLFTCPSYFYEFTKKINMFQLNPQIFSLKFLDSFQME